MRLNELIRMDFNDMLDMDDNFTLENVARNTGITLVTLTTWASGRVDLSNNTLLIIEDCMEEWELFKKRTGIK